MSRSSPSLDDSSGSNPRSRAPGRGPGAALWAGRRGSAGDFPRIPAHRELGDLGTPIAFELARRLRKAPRAIAAEIAAASTSVPGVRQVSRPPTGISTSFSTVRPSFVSGWGTRRCGAARDGKAIVEHTAINPNKAAHIGHLRNAALGDTLVRALRFRGTSVEVQNYIDDTGVQVADVVVGFREIDRKSLEEIRQIADSTRFDYYCWDLYSKVTEWYGGDKARLAIRAATLHDIEHGGNDNAAAAAFIADRIVRCHLKTMARLNVDYDLLTWEGDILRLKFWAQAFDVPQGQRRGLPPAGRPPGRLLGDADPGDLDAAGRDRSAGVTPEGVMDAVDPADTAADDTVDTEREKVIVRSNGVVTYVGKDIAYQFWKLGLLGRDFQYRVFVDRRDDPLWATCSTGGVNGHPPFGGASYVYNVIDVRQSYLQKLLKQALIAVGNPEGAERSHHFSYEMVALSHETARELGHAPAPDSEEARKPFVEVSGRKGLG
jgi:arginyl-tRNA synthetase